MRSKGLFKIDAIVTLRSASYNEMGRAGSCCFFFFRALIFSLRGLMADYKLMENNININKSF